MIGLHITKPKLLAVPVRYLTDGKQYILYEMNDAAALPLFRADDTARAALARAEDGEGVVTAHGHLVEGRHRAAVVDGWVPADSDGQPWMDETGAVLMYKQHDDCAALIDACGLEAQPVLASVVERFMVGTSKDSAPN